MCYPSCSPIFKFSHFRWVCCSINETYCTEVSSSSMYYVVLFYVYYLPIQNSPILTFRSIASSNNKRHTMQSVSAQTPLLAHLIFSTRQKMMSKRDYIIMMNVQTFLVLRCDEYFTFCVLYAKCFSGLSLSDV